MDPAPLLLAGLFRAHRTTRRQTGRRLQRAARDIQDARRLLKTDPAWAAALALQGALQALRALAFHAGLRPVVGPREEDALGRFAAAAFGPEAREEVAFLAQVGQAKRRAADPAGYRVTSQDAAAAVTAAERFLREARRRLAIQPTLW
ncbi:MAG: HEPN domain-containing protein [candidate division NC10 bacterium]|nr:HEPN domain-containing protein [candidate division NC10 bacterium]